MSTPDPVPTAFVEHERFRHAFRQVPAAVAVVLTRDASGAIRGVTCTSATSVSADPPMALVCIAARTGVGDLVRTDGWFSINVLAADRAAIARAFAVGGQTIDPATVRVGQGRTGVPVLTTGTVSVLECRLAAAHPRGDHWVLHGTVHHARFQADVEPLCYCRGSYGRFAPE
jgi:flavin reductase (DIM6/NTAB) family NADH-FMN oxidoreductase RutF